MKWCARLAYEGSQAGIGKRRLDFYIQVEPLTLKDIEYLPTKTSVCIQWLYGSSLSSELSCVNYNGLSHRICAERCICVSLEPEDVGFHKHDLECRADRIIARIKFCAASAQHVSLIYQPYLLPASLLFLLPAAKCSSRASFCVVATLTSCFRLFLPVPAIDLRGLCCAVSPAARSVSL